MVTGDGMPVASCRPAPAFRIRQMLESHDTTNLPSGILTRMKPEAALGRLATLRAELEGLPPATSWEPQDLTSWRARARSVLSKALGDGHHITEAFNGIRWTPGAIFGDNIRQHYINSYMQGRGQAFGLLDAAIAEIDLLVADGLVADDSGVDSELWEHVAPEINTEAWGKVAAQAVIFTEDRIRKWAGRPVGEVGKDLAVGVFGQSGQFRMGLTEGESQGWQFVAQGIAQAVRNVDAHRIQQRPDHKRYALGVVGACSLLLTQMRYEHGNRFRDVSPTSSDNS